MDRNVLLTGNSSGLNQSLTQRYFARGWSVYGCSRKGKGCQYHPGKLQDIHCDLADFQAIPIALEVLLQHAQDLDLALLDAGVLGELKEMHQTSLDKIQRIMDFNVPANKVILDWLHEWGRPMNRL